MSQLDIRFAMGVFTRMRTCLVAILYFGIYTRFSHLERAKLPPEECKRQRYSLFETETQPKIRGGWERWRGAAKLVDRRGNKGNSVSGETWICQVDSSLLQRWWHVYLLNETLWHCPNIFSNVFPELHADWNDSQIIQTCFSFIVEFWWKITSHQSINSY